MTSKVKVNTIETESGSTLTLGQSGDTVTLASGASQSGFGRTGTVDWQTTKKTASFTAVSGEGYFVDTSSSAITATLPASPSAGDIVYIKDYDGSFGSNNCTVARNSSNIRGGTSDFKLAQNNAGAVFIYVDATEGWQVFADGSDSDVQEVFISATGGTITTSGNYKIHTFTGPGTFTVSQEAGSAANNEVSYMVVAGGGGGGWDRAGGGGGGGFRESKSGVDCYSASPLEGATNITVTAQAYPITVGGGGTGGNNGPAKRGASGSNSVFSTITSAGGGGGGTAPGTQAGRDGGSGGGTSGPSSTAGSGNTPPVSPPQGNPGGTAPAPGGNDHGAGGGGATAAGSPGAGGTGGNGGAGATTSISASPTAYSGGGGGGASDAGGGPRAGGSGGSGGGGTGGTHPGGQGTAGTTNTGGGGGGGGNNPNTSPDGNGGAGGSGIVIIRYKFQQVNYE